MVTHDEHTFKDVFNNNYIDNSFFQEFGTIENSQDDENEKYTVSFSTSNLSKKTYLVNKEDVETKLNNIKKGDSCLIVINKSTNDVIYTSVFRPENDEMPDLQEFLEFNTTIKIQ